MPAFLTKFYKGYKFKWQHLLWLLLLTPLLFIDSGNEFRQLQVTDAIYAAYPDPIDQCIVPGKEIEPDHKERFANGDVEIVDGKIRGTVNDDIWETGNTYAYAIFFLKEHPLDTTAHQLTIVKCGNKFYRSTVIQTLAPQGVET